MWKISFTEDIVSAVLKEVAGSKEWSDPQKELLQTAAEHGSNGIPPDCHLFDQCKIVCTHMGLLITSPIH